jgi:hypothetical protein
MGRTGDLEQFRCNLLNLILPQHHPKKRGLEEKYFFLDRL